MIFQLLCSCNHGDGPSSITCLSLFLKDSSGGESEEEAESRDGRDRGARRAAESKGREDPHRQRDRNTETQRQREVTGPGRTGRDTGLGRDREAREHPTKELMGTERWTQRQRETEMRREKERQRPGQAQGQRNRLTRTFCWRELHEKTATDGE